MIPLGAGEPRRRRRAGLLAATVAFALGPVWTAMPAGAAELSARGFFRLEPQYADNLDLDREGRADAGTAFAEHELQLVLSLRTGEVEAAIGLELADGIAGGQNVRDPANPFDDSTAVQLSPDTESSIVDFFWVRWPARYLTIRAGWFTVDLDSHRFFLGEDGAPSLQLERGFGRLRVQYTYQKVAERAGISETPSSPGGPVVPAPRSTLVGVGDVDAHYLLIDLRREKVGPLFVGRAALWGVYAADRRPEDKARVGVVGGLLDLRLGPLLLYGEVDYLDGDYDGTTPVALDRGPGTVNDEVLTAGATLRGQVAFAGLGLDLGRVIARLPATIGVEGIRGSGDSDPTDGRAEDTTALTIIHTNLDDDFELSRLFGAFVLAGHAEYFERVANLTVVKPYLLLRLGRRVEVGAAAYWLEATRSVAATAGGAPTGERARHLGWQYEASVGLDVAPGVAARAVYAYLVPGPALRPGADAAQVVYAAMAFRF